MVWICQYEYPYDGSVAVSVWQDEESALKEACTNIQYSIDSCWQFPNCSQEAIDVAKEINDHIAAGAYRKAIRAWNGSDVNCGSDHAEYWYVREKDIQDSSAAPDPMVRPLTAFNAAATVVKSTSASVPDAGTISPPPTAFVASKCGATCRACNQFNEYAYADRADDTHVCSRCRILSA